MSWYFNGVLLQDASLNYTPQGARISITCDSSADLPTVADVQTARGLTMLIGSTADCIDDSSQWRLDSSGVWHQAQTSPFADVYTKQEVDDLLTPISSAITTLTGDVAALQPGFFTLGTVIEDGTDLDTLTTPGIYISTSGAHTGTLVHCPVSSSAFRMEVKYTALTTRYIQTLQAGATAIYTRNKYSNTAWNHWYKFEGTDTGA